MPTHIEKIEHIETANFYGQEGNLPKNTSQKGIDTDSKIFFYSLKERYEKRLESKLDERFEITLEVNEDWRIDNPATYKFDTEAKISNAVEAVQKAFHEKGRLLIVGSPGGGKTVLLLKFALELLGDDYRKNQKFPVIFDLALWSEEYENLSEFMSKFEVRRGELTNQYHKALEKRLSRFEEWLVTNLSIKNGLSKKFARTFLRENKIIFLFDGLDEHARSIVDPEKILRLDSSNDENLKIQQDTLREKLRKNISKYLIEKKEIPENKLISDDDLLKEFQNLSASLSNEERVFCLDLLNLYLRDGREAIICCRREEFIEIQKSGSQIAPVSAKVEILDLTKADIELALHLATKHKKSRASANNLLNIIGQNEMVRKTLRTPFYFTTALEVFDNERPLLNRLPTDAIKFKKLLLDRFVERKLSTSVTENPYKFEFEKTKKWLNRLAVLMEVNNFVTFELADLGEKTIFKARLFKLYAFFAVVLMISGFSLFATQMIFNNLSFTTLLICSIVIFLTGSYLLIVRPINKMGIKAISTINVRNLIYFPLGYFFAALLIGGILSLFDITFWGIYKSLWLTFLLVATWWFTIYPRFSGLSATKFQSAYQRLYFDSFREFIRAVFFLSFCCVYLPIKYVSFFLFLFIGKMAFHQELEKFGIFNNLYYSFMFYKISFDLKTFIPTDIGEIILIITAATIVGLKLVMSPLFSYLLVSFYFYAKGENPLYYATFLDYAAKARILEKDGGQWRFRHQNLQEYFANLKVTEVSARN